MPERLITFRGKGASERPLVEAEEGLPAKVPRKPTPLQLASQLKELSLPGPGSVYAFLSPSRAAIANKAVLVFVHPFVVEAGLNYATWLTPPKVPGGADPRTLDIWLKSEGKGRRYLIDATVNAGTVSFWGKKGGASRQLEIAGPDGFVQENTIKSEGSHVLWIAETQSGGWYGFALSCPQAWTFWYCQITRL